MKDNIDWGKANQIIGEGLYSGLAKVLMEVSHRQLARFGNRNSKDNPSILEIGAGRGEHFDFVKNDFSQYVMSDISTWGKSTIDEIIKKDKRVSFEIQDIEELTFTDETFDRVICSCVLIHVDQPYLALGELNMVTRSGGTISLYIAADPGVLLRLIRFIVTAPKMKKLDVPYDLINALSHRNNAGGLIEMCKFVFKDSKMKISYHPFRIKSWNFSTHIIVNIIKN